MIEWAKIRSEQLKLCTVQEAISKHVMFRYGTVYVSIVALVVNLWSDYLPFNQAQVKGVVRHASVPEQIPHLDMTLSKACSRRLEFKDNVMHRTMWRWLSSSL